jgi:hypothetical protein
MLEIFTNLLYKVIPENWYQTKRVCDLITKFCTNPILRGDIKAILIILGVIIGILAICFCYYMSYKIKKLKDC